MEREKKERKPVRGEGERKDLNSLLTTRDFPGCRTVGGWY